MKNGFALKAIKPSEVDDITKGFELELVALFRGLETEMYKEIRQAAKDGLTIDQALARVGEVLDKDVLNA